MKHQLTVASRILVAFASGALIAVFFLPAWRIDLFAPQYPEGLTMNIWINGLTGQVDIINGLNHYIGMQPISIAMFPEFKFLPYVVGFFMLLGMIVAITGNRKFLFVYLMLTAVGGLLALIDFFLWGKKYGSNLNPDAPIQVPGLTYQPPVFGHKRILNFDAYSFPDVGGWVVIAAGALAFTVWFVEWFKNRKRKNLSNKNSIAAVSVIAFTFIFSSCSAKPEPFAVGKDNCHFCKMGLTDTRFGAEILTKKGKVYKFDDLHCLIAFNKGGSEKEENIARTICIDYNKPNTFIDAKDAFYVTSTELKSPMGSNTAAFSTKADAAAAAAKIQAATQATWEQVKGKLSE